MSNDTLKIRAQAASYAKTFLANKYRNEYDELYRAYLVNRGVTTRTSKNMVDERELTTEGENNAASK
jgi:uncharacterized protein (UPF0305 family)